MAKAQTPEEKKAAKQAKAAKAENSGDHKNWIPISVEVDPDGTKNVTEGYYTERGTLVRIVTTMGDQISTSLIYLQDHRVIDIDTQDGVVNRLQY